MELVCNIFFWIFYLFAILLSASSMSNEVIAKNNKIIFGYPPRIFLVIFYMLIPYYYIGTEFKSKFIVGLVILFLAQKLFAWSEKMKNKSNHKT